MATSKIEITKAINPNWLSDNGYTIVLPKNAVHRVRILGILWNNTLEQRTMQKMRKMLSVTEGIEKRTFQKIKSFNFQFTETTVGKRIFNNIELFEEYKNQSFTIEVREDASQLIRYHFRVNLNKAEEFNIPKPEPILDPNTVVAIRKSELERPASIEIASDEQKENLARHICENVATGMFSIIEACDRYNVKYLEFAQWYATNEFVKQMYVEAMLMAKFFNASRQTSQIDKIINELLQSGKTRIETISYSKIYNPMSPEGLWIEEKKQVVERDIDEKGLVMLKQMVKDIQAPSFGMDELDTMADDEMSKLADELKLKISKKLNDRQ